MKKCLSSFDLKWIALITMTIDHIGLLWNPPFALFFRIIGRVSFPLFVFLLVEGFYHTRNRKKYLLRLFFFAFLSEPIYDFAVFDTWYYPYYQNIFFLLFFSLLMLILINRIDSFIEEKTQGMEKILFYITSHFFFVLSFSLLAILFSFDYGALGILFVYFTYLFHGHLLHIYFFYFLTILLFSMNLVQMYCLFAFFPLLFYSNEKGKSLKYFFYFYYPLHFFILTVVLRIFLL